MQQTALRATIGALIGAALWTLLSSVLASLPEGVRFVLTLFLFTCGPGAIALLWGVPDLSRPARVWLGCGLGIGLSAALADVMSRLDAVVAYPYVASALTGGVIACVAEVARSDVRRTRLGWRGALVIAVAAATGAVAFAHRLESTRGEIIVYGDYDSVDLSYYAAITSELTHQVPPLAPFYTGHALNYSWYPQLLLAMVHRFGEVPILSIYFRFAWPVFLMAAAACGFLFVSELAGASVACVALALILIGGDFSWIVAWFFKPDTYLWDWLLWPTNFLSPTMEVLHFSTWTPSLPVMFVGLFALQRQLRLGDARWGAVAAACFALLVEFKPFAFAILVGGMTAALAAARLGATERRGLALTCGLSVLLALPFLYQILSLYAESRSRLRLDIALLPRTMLDKLNLTPMIERIARPLTEGPLQSVMLGLVALPLFLAGGFGMRWLGVPRMLRAAFARDDRTAAAERVLAWMALAGIGVPFVLVTEPYHDTLQFYQTALYLMWVFAAIALFTLQGTARVAGVAAALVLSVPSSIHFLQDKWRDAPVHALAEATRGELAIAEYLRATDRDRTVIMHDRPLDPSLLVILAQRRSVLSWARYVTGSGGRRDDVEHFFESAEGDPQRALDTLAKYGVTHVIVRRDSDRVHQAVLGRMRQLMSTPDAVLYEVSK